jgi:hypothetical protein
VTGEFGGIDEGLRHGVFLSGVRAARRHPLGEGAPTPEDAGGAARGPARLTFVVLAILALIVLTALFNSGD